MKNAIIIFTVITTMMSGMIFVGCESPAQKAENAQTDVKDAKQDLKEAQQAADAAALKAASAEEWKTFKSESEVIIKDNEMRIAELKEKMKKTGKTLDAVYAESIAVLEQKNRDMKTRIDAYEKSQNGWESFKREFNHDMGEIGQALKDLAVNNKK